MSEGGFTGEGFAPDVGQNFHIETGGEVNNPTEASQGWLARNKDAVMRTLFKGTMAVTGGVTTALLTSADYRIGGVVVAAIGGWQLGKRVINHYENEIEETDNVAETTDHAE